MRFLFLLFSTLLLSIAVIAQSANCPEMVEFALENVGNICRNLGRNEICYGNVQVEASFRDSSLVFSQPADIVPVSFLQSIRTEPQNIERGTWGIAVMQIQASNIPNTLPGQVITFLLMGDVQIENAVAPEEAFIPVEAITINLRRLSLTHVEPNAGSRIPFVIPAFSEIQVDAKNPDGQWYRLSYGEKFAWISVNALPQLESLANLPVYDENSRVPMQSFYFTTGIGQPSCTEAPNQIIIQSPRGITTNLGINGIDVQVGSTIALQSASPNQVQLAVLDGHLVIEEQAVEAGFSIVAEIPVADVPSSPVISNPQALSETEIQTYTDISEASSESLNYIPEIPSVEEIEEIEESLSITPTSTEIIEDFADPSATNTATGTATRFITVTASPSATETATRTVTVTASPTRTATRIVTRTLTASPTRTASPYYVPTTAIPPTNTQPPPPTNTQPPPPTNTQPPPSTNTQPPPPTKTHPPPPTNTQPPPPTNTQPPPPTATP